MSLPPHPLDEYPIHQVPLSMRESASSDRNTYDRCIMHALNRDGSVQFAIGLGVYPNLGVIDAYAVVRRGTDLKVVRASDALTDDRMSQVLSKCRHYSRIGIEKVFVIDPEAQDGWEWDGKAERLERIQHLALTNGRNVALADLWREVSKQLE